MQVYLTRRSIWNTGIISITLFCIETETKRKRDAVVLEVYFWKRLELKVKVCLVDFCNDYKGKQKFSGI